MSKNLISLAYLFRGKMSFKPLIALVIAISLILPCIVTDAEAGVLVRTVRSRPSARIKSNTDIAMRVEPKLGGSLKPVIGPTEKTIYKIQAANYRYQRRLASWQLRQEKEQRRFQEKQLKLKIALQKQQQRERIALLKKQKEILARGGYDLDAQESVSSDSKVKLNRPSELGKGSISDKETGLLIATPNRQKNSFWSRLWKAVWG